ncbi:hypothetical protein JHK87_044822 [Glycine soja]|nr:hypothetical protein JHK87_044822 [Glycine soja]
MANGLFRRLISIAEINDKKETWKIVVQVINMWTIPRSPKYVIGEVAEIGQWNLHDKPKKVVFTMKDGCGSIMSCTLWESLTLEFKDCFDKHVSGLVVLLLSLAKIKEAKGTYSIAIQNSMYGSQIFVNTDMKEILEFKDRFHVDDRAVQPNESVILTLWDRECYALIKETANEIKQKMIDEDEVFDARDILEELDRVLGKTLAFRFKDPDSRVYPPQISAKDVSFQGVLKCGIGGAKTVAQRSSIENTKMIIMQPTPPIVLIEWIKKQKKDLRCKVLAEAEIMHPSLH